MLYAYRIQLDDFDPDNDYGYLDTWEGVVFVSSIEEFKVFILERINVHEAYFIEHNEKIKEYIIVDMVLEYKSNHIDITDDELGGWTKYLNYNNSIKDQVKF